MNLRYERTLLILFPLLIFFSIASSSSIAPGLLGNFSVMVIYLVLVIFFLLNDQTEYTLPRYAYLTISVIYLMYIVNVIRIVTGTANLGFIDEPIYTTGFTILTILYAVAFILASFVNLFIIPKVIDKDYFFRVVGVTAASIVLLGIPSMIIGPYNILWIEFAPYTTLIPFRSFGIDIPAMTSFYGDSNAMSKMAFFGTFAGLYEYTRDKNRFSLSILAINSIGLYLGNSRGAMLGAAVGLSMYILYLNFDKHLANRILSMVLLTALYLFLVLVDILPGFSLIKNINLSGRGVLWKATIQTILQNPLLGSGIEKLPQKIAPFIENKRWVGLNPQSSYLRMFLTTGFIGGTAYIIFLIRSLQYHIRNIRDNIDIAVLAFAIGLIVIQPFDNIPIFGVNQSAVISAIVFGYLVRSAVNNITGDNTT